MNRSSGTNLRRSGSALFLMAFVLFAAAGYVGFNAVSYLPARGSYSGEFAISWPDAFIAATLLTTSFLTMISASIFYVGGTLAGRMPTSTES